MPIKLGIQSIVSSKHANPRRGSSLIEVLIATAIMTLVMTAIVAGMATSIRSTAQARSRILAAKMSQEGIEYFRRNREIEGWDSFVTKLTSANTQTVCLTSLTTFPPTVVTPCPGTGVNSMFTRTALITIVDPTSQVAVKIITSWDDEGRSTKSNNELVQVFRKTQ